MKKFLKSFEGISIICPHCKKKFEDNYNKVFIYKYKKCRVCLNEDIDPASMNYRTRLISNLMRDNN